MTTANFTKLEDLGSPYPPFVAQYGAIPTVGEDVPIACSLMLLYLGAAVVTLALLLLNRQRGHYFAPSGPLLAFCILRIITLCLRIALAFYPTNTELFLTEAFFVDVGVLILFGITFVFAQRITRATHPPFGWSKPVTWSFRAFFILLSMDLILLLVVAIQSAFDLDSHIRNIDTEIWLTAEAFLVLCAVIPFPVVASSLSIPRRNSKLWERFGYGSIQVKGGIVLFVSALLTVGAVFRTISSFLPAAPINDPPWYYDKAAFYCFNFTIDILVIYIFLIFRVDLRFYVPDKARSAGGYAAAALRDAEKRSATPSSSGSVSYPEEDAGNITEQDMAEFEAERTWDEIKAQRQWPCQAEHDRRDSIELEKEREMSTNSRESARSRESERPRETERRSKQ